MLKIERCNEPMLLVVYLTGASVCLIRVNAGNLSCNNDFSRSGRWGIGGRGKGGQQTVAFIRQTDSG